jgi:hypothetical protein
MTEDFEYRGYSISSNGANYVARSVDGEELALVSRDVERLTTAIDQMWDGLEDGALPGWLKEPTTIDLDDPSIAHHFGEAKVLPAPQSHVKSKHVSPIILMAALAVAAPLAVFINWELKEVEPEIVFTLAVCAVAMFGRLHAIVLSLLSAAVFNFVAVPPIGAFTSPTREEIIYVLINVLAAIGIPMLLEWVGRARRAGVRTPST